MKAHPDEFTPGGHPSIKRQILDTWRAIKVSIQAANDAKKKDPTREYMQRPARAINMDGSFELGWGVFCLSGALSIYVGSLRPRPAWVSPVSWVLMLTMCLAPLLIPKLVKKFITWPRSGYVAFDPKKTRLARTSGLVLGAVIGAGLAMLWVAERQHSSIKGIVAALAGVLVLWVVFACFRVKKECDTAFAGQQPVVPPSIAAKVTEPPVTVPNEKMKRQIRISLFATLLAIFVIAPCVFGGIIYCWLHFALNHHARLNLTQQISTMMALICNPLLYLMINAVAVKDYKWKWIGFALLALGPLTIVTVLPEVWEELSKPNVAVPNTLSFFISAVWLISGALTLALFMIRHPKTQASTE